MRAAITLANRHETREIEHFWYRIYVAEMSRHTNDPLTDHITQTLHDPLTDSGNLFIARDENLDIVATLMTTLASTTNLGKYETLYGLSHLNAPERAHTSITTKLMVDPRYRRSRLPMLMARATYENALSLNVEQDYIDCNDHLVSFFKRLGYRPHLGRVVHRDYGAVNSMVLHLQDAPYLQSIGSPFYKSLLAELDNRRTTQEETAHVAA